MCLHETAGIVDHVPLEIFCHDVRRGTLDELSVVQGLSSSLALVPLRTYAGGKGQSMWDVRLLEDAPEEVGHGTLGVDGYVFPTVGVPAAGNCTLLDVIFFLCKRKD